MLVVNDYLQQLQNDEIMCKSLETAYEVDHRYASVKSLATLFVTLSDGSPELMPFVVNAVIGQEDGMENVAQGGWSVFKDAPLTPNTTHLHAFRFEHATGLSDAVPPIVRGQLQAGYGQ